MIILFICSKI